MEAEMHKLLGRLALLFAMLLAVPAWACDTPVSVCPRPGEGGFALIEKGRPAGIYVDGAADPAVRHVADAFAQDLAAVSGQKPSRLDNIGAATGNLIVIGVAGQSPAIDALVREGKLKLDGVTGQWEAYQQAVVERPWPNVPRALVIVGADRRGAVFGTYDLSEKIGVSPWYWFADVPIARRAQLYVAAGSRSDHPRVKYRGFFINDEAPSFSGWAQKHYGGVNSRVYARVFELLLRMKGNMLWPAMWAPRAFALDDPANIKLADDMGVVMGTSHHEPMTRAQAEWHRGKELGALGSVTGGKWDYTLNAENLRAFWRGGIERMMSKGGGKAYDDLVTVGMRGDGDEPMAEGTATQLLEQIVADQRKIIAEVTGKPADQTPQVWALYKEVQDYYDHGMRVPDDVTLLFSDDNWGQIRRLPDPAHDDVARKGGYGVYYHFDYVGGPRNYKWINTNEIGKVWQQMDLAYRSGARNLWIVNVGDIKPMEFPLSFFLAQAWNPEAMTVDALKAYPGQWARETFGPELGPDVASLIDEYSRLAARRKPELVDAASFDANAGSSAELRARVPEWQALAERARKVEARVPADQHSAWFQLVGYPIYAFSNLYELIDAQARNHEFAATKNLAANAFADKVAADFATDARLTQTYHGLNHGKWNGMMAQVHMGYTIWQDPPKQVMPSVTRVAGPTPSAAESVTAVLTSFTRPGTGFDRAMPGSGMTWQPIPYVGPSGAIVALPQSVAPTTPENAPHVEYDWTLAKPGKVRATLRLAPTLDTRGSNGVRIGVSVDGGPVQTLVMNLTPVAGDPKAPDQQAWHDAVIANAYDVSAEFPALSAGQHTLKLWRLDGNVVVETVTIAPAAM
jgi:hypothetical protein